MNEGRRSVASSPPDRRDKATWPVVLWAPAAALCFTLAACGQRGPLSLPPQATLATPAASPASPASPASSPTLTP